MVCKGVKSFKINSSSGYCTPYSTGGGDLCREKPDLVVCKGKVHANYYLKGCAANDRNCVESQCASEPLCVGYTWQQSTGLAKLKSSVSGSASSSDYECWEADGFVHGDDAFEQKQNQVLDVFEALDDAMPLQDIKVPDLTTWDYSAYDWWGKGYWKEYSITDDDLEIGINPDPDSKGAQQSPTKYVVVAQEPSQPGLILSEVQVWVVELVDGKNWRGDKSKMKKVAENHAEDLAFENFWKQELQNVERFGGLAKHFYESKIVEESVQEVVDCSWELFDSDDRKNNDKFSDETFVFGPSFTPGDSLNLDAIRVPTQHKRNCEDQADCEGSKYDIHGQYNPSAVGEYFLFENLNQIYNLADLTECMEDLMEEAKKDIYETYKKHMKAYKEPNMGIINVNLAFRLHTFHDKVEDIFFEYLEDFEDQCVQKELMDVITHGLALTFGEKASPGKSQGML